MITCSIPVGRLLLLCSRTLVAQCQLAAASSRRVAEVSLAHKGTASSIASGNNHSRSNHDHRASIRTKIIKSFKDNASFVVVSAIKPRSVN